MKTTKAQEIINFLKGKTFRDVRQAHRAFKIETGITVSYIRFYIILKKQTETVLQNKQSLIKNFVLNGEFKKMKEAFNAYNTANPENQACYLYFINVFKSVKPKPVKEKKVVEKPTAVAETKIIEPKSTVENKKVEKKKQVKPKKKAPTVAKKQKKTAVKAKGDKQINIKEMPLAEVLALVKKESKVEINTEDKNKEKILQQATTILTNKGYEVVS